MFLCQGTKIGQIQMPQFPRFLSAFAVIAPNRRGRLLRIVGSIESERRIRDSQILGFLSWTAEIADQKSRID
jgi:hypothetical protein